jgi:hypothetical protein
MKFRMSNPKPCSHAAKELSGAYAGHLRKARKATSRGLEINLTCTDIAVDHKLS